MLKTIKKFFKGIAFALAATFTGNKGEGQHRHHAPISGEKEPVLELDTWARLLNEMQSPDADVRAAAEETWNNKKTRDSAFFEGMNFSNVTKPEDRGKPLETRAGWGAKDEHTLPRDDWADDREWRSELKSKKFFDRLDKEVNDHDSVLLDAHNKINKERILSSKEQDYNEYFKKNSEHSAEELDRDFYGTNARDIGKEELEKSIGEFRKQLKPSSGEG